VLVKVPWTRFLVQCVTKACRSFPEAGFGPASAYGRDSIALIAS
jgi:hypothetical protein